MELPDFERLRYLAEEKPEELERLRMLYSQHLIDRAPEKLRRKLQGLLFKIDMETRRSKNSIDSCIKISRMMMDSFSELQDALNCRATQDVDRPRQQTVFSDNIIPFPEKSKLQ